MSTKSSGTNPRGKKPTAEKPGPNGTPNQKFKFGSPLAYIFLLLLGFFLFRSVFAEAGVQKVAYSDFKEAIAQGRFAKVEIGGDYVKGYLRPGASANPAEKPDEGANATPPADTNAKGPSVVEPFARTTARLPWMASKVQNDPELLKVLDQHGVTYDAKTSSGLGELFWIWVVPIALAMLFWSFMMRRVSGQIGQGPPGIMTFGKTRARVHSESDTGISFKDVAGIDEAVDELREIVEFLKTPEKFRRLGGKIPKGVLLVGPPGTGKTLLARAVAGEAGVPFFSLTGSEFVEMFVGVGAARVRDLFQQAQQKAPCIIFIDELDAIGKSRNGNVLGGHDEREQTLNQLLAEMDGFDSKVGLIVIAATNRPEILDPALMRPGRFDRQVLVDRPDRRGREEILSIHCREVKLGPDVNIRDIASRTPGFAGADLANVCNEAALLAARKGRDHVAMRDFDEAIERVVAGLEKKNRRMNEREKQIVAFHESGHAVVGWMLPFAERVHKVSIIPRGLGALGYTLQVPLEDRYLMSFEELRDKIAALMGGRAAEELFVGSISTGASNDLKQATEIAKLMVREYGMSSALGPVTLAETGGRSAFLGPAGAAPEMRTYSEETQMKIDEEVRSIVQEGLDRARATIRAHRDQLQALASRLLITEVVDNEELTRILGEKVKAHQPLLAPHNEEEADAGMREPWPDPGVPHP